jgi:hypothetical protein
MPFGFDDRFNAKPGELDPRFQPTSPVAFAVITEQIGLSDITLYRGQVDTDNLKIYCVSNESTKIIQSELSLKLLC